MDCKDLAIFWGAVDIHEVCIVILQNFPVAYMVFCNTYSCTTQKSRTADKLYILYKNRTSGT